MKKRNLLKLALLTLAALPMGTWAIDFGEEATVSTELNWNVNTLTTDEPTSSKYTGNTPYEYKGVYIRKANSAGISSGSTKWSDGTDVSWTSILNFGAATESQDGITSSERTAGVNNSIRRCVAFNANVAGTCYVMVRVEAVGTKVSLYHKNSEVASVSPATTGTYHEIKYTTSQTGAFYIAANGAYKISAIRFVPLILENEISIGTTGYATYSNNYDFAFSPESGLTAYKAAAGDDGHSVTLTAVSQMRPTSGYVVKGTPGNSYSLTAVADQKKSADGPGSMKRAAVYGSDVIPATAGGNYNYLLGNDSGTAKFFAPNGASVLNAKKAFLQVNTQLTPPPASARGIDIIIEDGTTGIMQITRSKYGADEYFNLAGQRVANPTKGLYIVNGKKVIVK